MLPYTSIMCHRLEDVANDNPSLMTLEYLANTLFTHRLKSPGILCYCQSKLAVVRKSRKGILNLLLIPLAALLDELGLLGGIFDNGKTESVVVLQSHLLGQ